MKKLFLLLCMGVGIAAHAGTVNTILGGNVGIGAWCDDLHILHDLRLQLPAGVPDGSYFLHTRLERDGVLRNGLDVIFTVSKGEVTSIQPDHLDNIDIYGASTYGILSADSTSIPGGYAVDGGISDFRKLRQATSAEEFWAVWSKGTATVYEPFYISLYRSFDEQATRAYDVKVLCPQEVPGMAQYNVHALAVSLNISDTPLLYRPAAGPPMAFSLSYNQREASDPATFSSTNFGRCWSSNWLAYVSDDPSKPSGDVQVRLAGGGSETHSGFSQTTASFTLHPQSRALLKKTLTGYERQLPDGSKEIYGFGDGATAFPRRFFLTQKLDPQGRGFVLSYEQAGGVRLAAITDMFGRATRLSYENADDPLKPTKVVDPFGRCARFAYNTQRQLEAITDQIGLVSSFVYGAKDFIGSMTTPYGSTSFAAGQSGNNRWLEITDPLGAKERMEFRDKAPGIAASEAQVPAGFEADNKLLQYNNTFYWDKRAMRLAPGDYSKARIFHWLNSADGKKVSGIIGSQKAALEGRVWYRYANQSDPTRTGTTGWPTKVARLLDDGSSQGFAYEYDSNGRCTKTIDPVGRARLFEYNGADLVRVRQRCAGQDVLVCSMSYSLQHQMLTRTEASGATTRWSYNAYGQVTSMTDALGLGRTFVYQGDPTDPSCGALRQVQGPSGQPLAAYSYDGFGRVASHTDADGRTIRFGYDAAEGDPSRSLDRIARVTYPDGTFEEAGFKGLDIEWIRNRAGGISRFRYDALRRLVSVADPLGRTTTYTWLVCGALQSLTDPAQNTTSWTYDLQGRLVAKAIGENTVASCRYEALSGRLSETTDALQQTTRYAYFSDNSLKQVDYPDALHPSASVSFSYDPDVARPTSMSDATGTTRYAYHPFTAMGGARLAQIDGPLADDTLSFSYDLLGRLTERKLNGIACGQSYDSLGRLGQTTSPLGAVTMAYENSGGRIKRATYSNGMLADFGYAQISSEPLLESINYYKPNQFSFLRLGYGYRVPGQIDCLTEWLGKNRSATWYTYDAASQLLGTDAGAQGRCNYAYDVAGNRIGAYENDALTTSVYNNSNQLIRQSDGEGSMPFVGWVTQNASVTINGQPTSALGGSRFAGWVPVVAGTNTVSITATGSGGAVTTQRYRLVVNGGATRDLLHDANGNLVADGNGQSYEWDAANRLVAIRYEGTQRRTEFTYDGLGRVATLVEKEGDSVLQQTHFLWHGTELVEQRQGDVVTSYFPEGFTVRSGTRSGNYFCLRDHQGSVRVLVDGAGTVQARYAYAPFGQRTRTEGEMESELGFTGHFYHAVSGLHLAPCRVYSPRLGRWLSRDPLGESAGNNMYAYVENDPINNVDPLGLKTCLRSLRITYFGDLPSDKIGTRDNPLKPGDIAVGHFGTGQHPKKGDPWVLPFGTAVIVTPDHSPEFQGAVADVGAFDKKHPELAGPSEWIDVWDPVKSRARQSDTGWVEAQVKDGCACPGGYLEVRRAVPVVPVPL